MDILSKVDAILDAAIALRRQIHSNPELSGHEEQTENTICATLDRLGIPYTRGVADHGVVAVIGTGREPAVGCRGDIDALPVTEATGLPFASRNPGVMHACGHDMHTSCLLGTAMVLKGMEKEIPGTVKLFFQPAEETIGGAKRMIEAGCMEAPKVTRVVGWHVDPTIPHHMVQVPTGKMNAATCSLDVTIKGIGCHGAHPDRGVDAVVAASHVIVALQSIPARNFAPTTPVIITVGSFHGGTKGNIIAGEVRLEGTLRALENSVMAELKEHVRRCIEETAKAYGATADVCLTDGYPALVNDRDTSLTVLSVVKELFGEEKVFPEGDPSLGADDFAFFANAAGGCYYNVGTLAKGQTNQSLHSEFFCPDESILRTAIAVQVGSALKLLEKEAK